MKILKELWKNVRKYLMKNLKIILYLFDFSITSIIIVMISFCKNVIHDNYYYFEYIFLLYNNYIYIY